MANSEILQLRSKRHAVMHDVTADDVDIDSLTSEKNMSPSTRRHRRSAVFMLHAAMKLCDSQPLFCGRIELTDKDVRLSIEISDH